MGQTISREARRAQPGVQFFEWAATPARHVLCVRKGTRALLAALRACGATVRVVTANLMGVEAVAALAAHEAATEAEGEGWQEQVRRRTRQRLSLMYQSRRHLVDRRRSLR